MDIFISVYGDISRFVTAAITRQRWRCYGADLGRFYKEA